VFLAVVVAVVLTAMVGSTNDEMALLKDVMYTHLKQALGIKALWEARIRSSSTIRTKLGQICQEIGRRLWGGVGSSSKFALQVGRDTLKKMGVLRQFPILAG
jgi:hypothetical protein